MSTKELIDKATEKAGSQQALADMLGLKQQNISALKTGRRAVTTDLRVKLAKIADYDLKVALIEGVIEKLDSSEREQAEAATMLQAVVDAFPNAGWRKRSLKTAIESTLYFINKPFNHAFRYAKLLADTLKSEKPSFISGNYRLSSISGH